jgi:transcriptional regulator with PAS, ATPase and Fis domain
VAAAGTIFLDEVAELPLKLQAKLLRVVEEKKFRRLGGSEERTLSARILAGSNTPLDHAVAQNHFRADLFYRLNVARIELPPLRERVGDVRLLAEYFVSRHADDGDSHPLRLAPESVRALETHHWPGNIRELKNVIERAVVVCIGEVIEPAHLSLQRRSYVPLQGAPSRPHIEIPDGGKTLEAIVSEAIRITVEMFDGNLSAAARRLGISRPTLARKLKADGVSHRSVQKSQ